MRILSTSEVATLLGVSGSIVRALIDKGVLASEPRFTERARRRVRREALEAFAKEHGVTLDWSLLNKEAGE